MATLQTISSGAFKFSSTLDNRTRVAIAGTMNISVDEDNQISGDFRVHDAITPGGLPTPPAGTLSYMLTEKASFKQEFLATANGQNVFTANTIINGPFLHQDNVRVFIDDEEIRPYFNAFNIDYGNSKITITNSDFYNRIIEDKTIVRLEWLDDSFNGGITERDGWHFCDGRTLEKQYYSALYESIGDLWNDMIKPEDVIKDSFNRSQIHPFNEIRTYEGNGLYLTYDISFDTTAPNNVIVYRRTPTQVQTNSWEQAERLVEGTHYTKSTDGTSITFEQNEVLQSRWEILILSKKPTTKFQIPDLRGYYLRMTGSNTNLAPDGVSQNYGISSKQGDAIEKHSHFMILNSAGSHQHNYVPWFYYSGLTSAVSTSYPSEYWRKEAYDWWSYSFHGYNNDTHTGINKGKMPGSGSVQATWNDQKAVRRGLKDKYSTGNYQPAWDWHGVDPNPDFYTERNNFYDLNYMSKANNWTNSYAYDFWWRDYMNNQFRPPMYGYIEPRFFLLGAGPCSPIPTAQKYHYHEIWLGDPDASGPHTSSNSFRKNFEVDMFHIKLPIFIKY